MSLPYGYELPPPAAVVLEARLASGDPAHISFRIHSGHRIGELLPCEKVLLRSKAGEEIVLATDIPAGYEEMFFVTIPADIGSGGPLKIVTISEGLEFVRGIWPRDEPPR